MLRILWKKQKIFLPVFNRLIRIRKNSLLCIIDNYTEQGVFLAIYIARKDKKRTVLVYMIVIIQWCDSFTKRESRIAIELQLVRWYPFLTKKGQKMSFHAKCIELLVKKGILKLNEEENNYYKKCKNLYLRRGYSWKRKS